MPWSARPSNWSATSVLPARDEDSRSGATNARTAPPIEPVQLKRLIMHEGDKRRHDDRNPRQDEGGKLKAEALAESGRQETKGVPALGDGPDHGQLAWLKVGRVVGQLQQARDSRGPGLHLRHQAA